MLCFLRRGLAPEYNTVARKHQKNRRQTVSETVLEVGDAVALKEKKDKIGALVINTGFLDGPKMGRVKRIHDMDRNGDSFDRKYYTVESLDLTKSDNDDGASNNTGTVKSPVV